MVKRLAIKATPDLMRACVAEVVGTFLMVFIGTSVVATAVLTNAQVGLWQVAVVWGVGVTLAIYATAAVSGAHLNPAVTLAFAILRPRDFPADRVLPYWAAQLVGGVLAGVGVLIFFHTQLASFETANALVRGAAGSQRSAMVFGEYFPNAAMYQGVTGASSLVTPLAAALAEGVGTAILGFVIFALVDNRNAALPAKHLAPILIGATVATVISIFAPISQAGLNPARDFGPRIVAFLAGWGHIAIPGPRDGFWVYIVGPLIGAPVGAAIYDLLLRPALLSHVPTGSETSDGDE